MTKYAYHQPTNQPTNQPTIVGYLMVNPLYTHTHTCIYAFNICKQILLIAFLMEPEPILNAFKNFYQIKIILLSIDPLLAHC